MFTGIIETIGFVKELHARGGNITFWIESSISKELKIDQSLAHNGVCLTVEETRGNLHRVTAIKETLEKTTMGEWTDGRILNLERCLKPSDRLDGHFVQGHVDTRATCIEKKSFDGSWQYRFRFPENFASLVIEKGSICVDGISLTAFNVSADAFTVAIIPYTLQHTNMQDLSIGDLVNLEFDMIGKYVVRKMQLELQNS